MSTPEEKIPLEVSPTDSTKDGVASTETGVPELEPTVPEPVIPSYAGTRIEGRTAEEASAYIQLIEKTVAEQASRITEVESTPVQPAAPPEPEMNFYDNPTEVLRREIASAVAPLNEQIAAFQASRNEATVWSQIEQEIPDFGQYKHLVQKLIEGHGYKTADLNVSLLRNLYYTAVGWNQRHGGQQVKESTPESIAPQTHIPQHKPSTAPLPASQQVSQVRELTEQERRLAREWGQTPEEFTRLQDADIDVTEFSNDA